MVLTDLIMPKLDGFELIQEIKANPRLASIPIMVLTSEKDAEVKSIDMGAVDFIQKPYDAPEIIRSRIKRMIELSDDRSIIRSTERDQLTNLFTKNYFFEYCSIMEKYHPERSMDAIIIDIDHYHLMNEIYGHSFGDSLLKKIADIIKNFSNDNEGIAGRGENATFYMYLNHQEDYNGFIKILNKKLTDEFNSNHVHIRMGINLKKSENTDITSLFTGARLANDTIIGQFHKSIAYFDENLQEKAFFQERLIHDINTAIEEKQFIPYFQPKYSIQGDKNVLSGCEALIRWNHPELGMISPNSFINLFESNGLIQMVDTFIWNEVAKQIKHWKETLGMSIPISVNVSRIDFFDPGLSDKLIKLVEEHGLSFDDIHLEITESAYVEHPETIIQIIENLRSKGFVIEMDDFGTGYSSLGVLSSIPIDILKIDMKFIRSMHDNEKNRRMVEIIMDIAKMLNVPVIAEGVETQNQYSDLKGLGCEMIQGYYFSRPVPSEEFEQILKNKMYV